MDTVKIVSTYSLLLWAVAQEQRDIIRYIAHVSYHGSIQPYSCHYSSNQSYITCTSITVQDQNS